MSSICPLTGEALPENDLNIAVVYQVPAPYEYRQCGHEMTLQPLLEKCLSSPTTSVQCPSCAKGLVISVCDKVASERIRMQDSATIVLRCIAVRYGAHNYFFTVGIEQCAQDRLVELLGDDVKILHGGKTVYPNEGKTRQELSDQLLHWSSEDIASRKRPTLIVTGAKTGRWGSQAGHLHK